MDERTTRAGANLALVESEHHKTLDRLIEEIIVFGRDILEEDVCSSQNPDSHLSVLSIFRSANFKPRTLFRDASLSIRRKASAEIRTCFLGNMAALGRADRVVIGGVAERTAFLLQRELTDFAQMDRVEFLKPAWSGLKVRWQCSAPRFGQTSGHPSGINDGDPLG
jgi:hypothetical protein